MLTYSAQPPRPSTVSIETGVRACIASLHPHYTIRCWPWGENDGSTRRRKSICVVPKKTSIRKLPMKSRKRGICISLSQFLNI